MGTNAINDEVTRWAVHGHDAAESEALDALSRRSPLLLLMHGFGSFEGDLITLAGQLPPEFVCASPRAPLVAPEPIVDGYSWWPLAVGSDGLPQPQHTPDHFEGSAPHDAALAVIDWLDRLQQRVSERQQLDLQQISQASAASGKGLGRIALMGFSQGGCLVTSLLRIQPERFACGVNCSGFVAPGEFAGDAALARVRPSMFWGRDDADPIIGRDRIELTETWARVHTTLKLRRYTGMLHSIGTDELQDISEFLRQQLSPTTSSAQT